MHTLGDYFRQHGAEVTTLRFGFSPALLDSYAPDLVVLSPGPGRPADFGCAALLDEVYARGLPAFGVCLGLQAMVEHAGGVLSLLPEPVHGKPGLVRVAGGALLAGLPAEFTAGRYHSLYAPAGEVRGDFTVTAATPDGVVMAIEDAQAGRWAVQFHPESILTASGRAGHQIIANVLDLCRAGQAPSPDRPARQRDGQPGRETPGTPGGAVTTGRAVITNDDGIGSEGLRVLARAAVQAGWDVVVAAPERQASGSGAAMTMVQSGGRVIAERHTLPGLETVPAYAVQGTPAFIAFTAVRGAFGPRPDYLLSGVNLGPNTGQVVLHSGTVGAAMTAANHGVRAAAFSLDAEGDAAAVEWDSAADVAAQILPALRDIKPGIVLNVNVPNIPKDRINGIRQARLAAGRGGGAEHRPGDGGFHPGHPDRDWRAARARDRLGPPRRRVRLRHAAPADLRGDIRRPALARRVAKAERAVTAGVAWAVAAPGVGRGAGRAAVPER